MNAVTYYLVFLLVFCVLLNAFETNGELSTTEIVPTSLWNATYTDKLRKDLLSNYDKFSRPTPYKNVTKTQFNMVIRHVELNEFKSTMNVYAYLRITWTDDKLKWNKSEYGGVGLLHITDHEIWQPDIFLYNSAVSIAMTNYNAHGLVYSTGEVLWIPSTQFSVFCNINLKYWPFDTQSCILNFGSWTHHGNEIDLDIMNNATTPILEANVQSTEWKVGKTTIKKDTIIYKCCPEPYISIKITINLIRTSPSYTAIIITPAFVIIGLILSTFWLPPQAGEKILLNVGTAIIITLFLLYFAQKLPAMGTHTPLVVLFYSSCLWVTCFTLIGSVFVIWISRKKHTRPLPWFIRQPLAGRLGRWLGIRSYINYTVNVDVATAEEMRDHQVTDFEYKGIDEEKQFIAKEFKTQYQSDWILLAVAVDRISFIFYSLLFLILSLSYCI